MKNRIHILTLLALVLLSYQCFAASGTQNLRCEMLVNPQGIGTTHPRLSWEITGDGRGIIQTAYQILVASTPIKLAANQGDLWDSHKMTSDRSVMVAYAGKLLMSRTACYWKVKVWTTNGESAWSNPAQWTMGLLNPADWKAKWIGYDNGFPWDSVSKFSRLSARYYRKQFDVSQTIKKATVYVVGLGHYELFVNGKQIGDQVLSTPPTDYTESVIYNTFDVTKEIKPGTNAIATTLGNGRFFTMRPKYKPKKIKEFGFPKMLLQLELEYTNGTKQTIVSDGSWKFTADGPIRTNNEYDGEEYDATKEMAGWNHTGFDDSKWLKPELVQAPGGKLVPQMNEPIRVVKLVKPVSIKLVKPGMYVMDMGQNMAGWLNMKVTGNRGQKVQLRYAETTKDGELYVTNLRDAKVTDVYTLKGDGPESWHPVFVYHGFRYVEIVNYPGTPTVDDFEGQVVNDDLEITGSFETSNALVNRIYQNAVWGIQANYKGMPLDCPQRNERMPWLADHATGSYSESFVFDNAKLYAKWLDDIEQAQKPNGSIPDVAPAYWNYYSDNMTWPATYLQVADMLYQQYGDKEPIAKHYASMKKWLAYMRTFMKDYIETKDKYGDWCVPPESPELIHSKDTLRTTDGQLIATAYYYRLLGTMQKFAKLLNKPQDMQEFAALAAKIKARFNQKYFDAKTARYSNNSVTSNLLPLYFDMVPAGERKAVFKNIDDKIVVANTGHISTGVIGTQWLMRGLTDNGRPDIAWHIATNTDYPSWGYMVSKGATTFWELWNGDTANPSMNSQNHVMLLGDLLVWFYEDLAGIKSDATSTAFKKIIMKPEAVRGLDFVNASYHSIHGLIKSDWKNIGGKFHWSITVPANTTAMVYVPAKSAEAVTEGGQKANASKSVKFIKMENGRAVFEVGSGNYVFDTK
ncbi:alpha-L-rhamnosidase [Mucilaginibacter boryungensis]|uniref:alpha-L-rhamnosidase n=1 Tax=Mucilaginibacter boryungensis TaxID=768480 RepID=A0ABR9XE63_9SPHI|nr:alpha-L-rhamnosidase [Mucilaginibacter boryungensis]MBE9665269.1 family 78 glycoside hydrolase catalytic domain [Mucilaginibacter boryungensis]